MRLTKIFSTILFSIACINVFGQVDTIAGTNLYFDGSTNFVDTRFREHLKKFTASCWVKSPNAPTYNQGKGPVHYEENFQFNWDHVANAARNAVVLRDSLGRWHGASFGELKANTWYYLAATYDGDTLKAYCNGKLVTVNAEPIGPPRQEPNSLKIGKHAKLSNPMFEFFNGWVDEVRVWDRVLSETEIRRKMHLPIQANEAGLVLYYQFNETLGDSTKNLVNLENAPLINAPQWEGSTAPFGAGSLQEINISANTNSVDFDSLGVVWEKSSGLPTGLAQVVKLNTLPVGEQPQELRLIGNWYIFHHFYANEAPKINATYKLSDAEGIRLANPSLSEFNRIAARPPFSDTVWVTGSRATSTITTSPFSQSFDSISVEGQYFMVVSNNNQAPLFSEMNSKVIQTTDAVWLKVTNTEGLKISDILGREVKFRLLSNSDETYKVETSVSGLMFISHPEIGTKKIFKP